MKIPFLISLFMVSSAISLNANASNDSLKYYRAFKISLNYGLAFARGSNEVAQIPGRGTPIGIFSPSIIWRNKNRQWHELQWSTLIINQKQTWQKYDAEGLLTTKLQVGLKYLRSVQGSKGSHRLPVFWCFGISAQGGRFDYTGYGLAGKQEKINFASVGMPIGLRTSWVSEKGFYIDGGLFTTIQCDAYFMHTVSTGTNFTQFGVGAWNLTPQISFGYRI